MSLPSIKEGAVLVDTVPKRCPFVLLALKKALGTASSGQLIAVRTIDPQAVEDIRAYCSASALAFEGVEAENRTSVIYVRNA